VSDDRERPWRERFLVFGAPTLGAAERDEVIACLESGWLGTGPRVAEFERRLGAYLDAPTAVAVSSCSAALHLALAALDLPPGSEVITSSMTFCATANAIVHAGHEPVFADCDPRTLNIDVADVRRKLTPRTRSRRPSRAGTAERSATSAPSASTSRRASPPRTAGCWSRATRASASGCGGSPCTA